MFRSKSSRPASLDLERRKATAMAAFRGAVSDGANRGGARPLRPDRSPHVHRVGPALWRPRLDMELDLHPASPGETQRRGDVVADLERTLQPDQHQVIPGRIESERLSRLDRQPPDERAP